MTASALAALDGPSTLPAAPHERRRLAVVVPCYNEADSLANLAAGLERLRAVVAEEYELEIVLVDDGSRDRTWNLLQERFASEPAIRLVKHETNRGIATAIATG